MGKSRKLYICPNCNGEIIYDVNSRSNKCRFCDNFYVINRYNFISDFENDTEISKCNNCGGNIIFKDQRIGICQACECKINIIKDTEVEADEIEDVDMISPFLLNSKEAYELFIRKIGENQEIPLDLFRFLKIKLSDAQYIPSILIEIEYNTSYSAKIGFNYNEEYLEYVKNGDKYEKKIRVKTVTKWENTNGSIKGNCLFERNITTNIYGLNDFNLLNFTKSLNNLCEFNTSHKFEDYDERFLAGYAVAKFDLNGQKVIDEILPLLEKNIQNDIRNFIVADEIDDITFRYSYKKNENIAYVPVYFYLFEYKGQEYYISQTGEDGKIFGDLPSDPDIKFKLDLILMPFWGFLGLSILLFIIFKDELILFILIALNIAIYFVLKSLKQTKILENESLRNKEVEMFLDGSIYNLDESKAFESIDLSEVISSDIEKNNEEKSNILDEQLDSFTDSNSNTSVNNVFDICDFPSKDDNKTDNENQKVSNFLNFNFFKKTNMIVLFTLIFMILSIVLYSKFNQNKIITKDEVININQSSEESIFINYSNQVSAGREFSIYINVNGKVVGFGDNTYDQLNFDNWSDIVQVSAGGFHTLGLKSDGTVVATGYNNFGQLEIDLWTNIKQVSGGRYHSLGLTKDGTVVCVGEDKYGVCNTSSWTNIIQVSAGRYNSYGLRKDGTVISTLDNEYGQANISNWTNMTQISAGTYHVIGLKSDGTVVCVGGQKGDGVCNVSSWSDIKQVVGAGYHSIGLRNDGTVVAVGNNDYGQTETSGLKNIKEISGGRFHTIAIDYNGKIIGIGSNEFGQLPKK